MWSPDGAAIAYISPEGLSVAAAEGSDFRLLVPGALEQDFPLTVGGLAWSPTGDRIAVVRTVGAPADADRGSELAVWQTETSPR